MVQSIRRRHDEHTLRPQGQANGMGGGLPCAESFRKKLLKQQKGLCAATVVCWRLCDTQEHS